MKAWEEDLLVDDLMELLDSCLPALRPGQSCWPINPIWPSDQLSVFDMQFASMQPTISKKQLRALSKKHLLMMIHDLERELQQEKEYKGYLLQAYQAMLPRWPVPAETEKRWISASNAPTNTFALPASSEAEQRKLKMNLKKKNEYEKKP